MALDLSDQLARMIKDPTHITWTTQELTDMLAYALAETNRVRNIRTTETIAAVASQDTYTLTTIQSVHRVDLLDASNKVVMIIPGNAWEIWGDNMSPSQTLYINPSYSLSGYTFRIHGYVDYDYTTNTPPQMVQNAILAVARAEALRRILAERARFEQYASSNPRGDSSMTEVYSEVQDAQRQAESELNKIRLLRMPMAGRR